MIAAIIVIPVDTESQTWRQHRNEQATIATAMSSAGETGSVERVLARIV